MRKHPWVRIPSPSISIYFKITNLGLLSRNLQVTPYFLLRSRMLLSLPLDLTFTHLPDMLWAYSSFCIKATEIHLFFTSFLIPIFSIFFKKLFLIICARLVVIRRKYLGVTRLFFKVGGHAPPTLKKKRHITNLKKCTKKKVT